MSLSDSINYIILFRERTFKPIAFLKLIAKAISIIPEGHTY